MIIICRDIDGEKRLILKGNETEISQHRTHLEVGNNY